MNKTNPQPQYRLRLRILAVHNDANILSNKDRQLISDLLRHLADGGNTEEFFGISTPRHRPTSSAIEKRVFDVCLAMAPEAMGGKGLNRAKAISEVALIHKIDDERIIENLKSPRGKELFLKYTRTFRRNEQGD